MDTRHRGELSVSVSDPASRHFSKKSPRGRTFDLSLFPAARRQSGEMRGGGDGRAEARKDGGMGRGSGSVCVLSL